MRRTALQFTLPALCGLMLIALLDPMGKAAESRPARSVPPTTAPIVKTADKIIAKPAPKSNAPKPAAQVKSAAQVKPAAEVKPARSRVIMMEVTAYCPCPKCCGPKARGITASGRHVSHNKGLFVAADTRLLPFYTKLKIPGYAGEQPVQVLDRGGAIKGNKLDVFFPSHKTALQWGRQKIAVTVVD